MTHEQPEAKLTPAALVIDHHAGISGSAIRTAHLFATRQDAEAAFEAVKRGVELHHSRANDRERVVSFETITGPVAVDTGSIVALGVDDCLGDARAQVEAWHQGLGEIRALAGALK